ncbi:uncharacterized protein LOC131605382 [Vicia villosa]|uniref:uncharacterized protein LOC131605382 n=1 Tax=Vicia villosa TaxID=3911 RepID=UPI00273AE8D4|nr:uncharacterized protein LOC131605382 [Vicia villosa]
MIHGPCGYANTSSPCMKSNQCSKFFPKKFQARTVVDHEGYPLYMRRDTGITVTKKDVDLDNRFVVPYNPYLLKKFQARINIEWCNQGTSVKYLFKYINKGYDRITATVVDTTNDGSSLNGNLDEIKQYLDCRYVSPSKACWRIFSFPIHGRSPAVESVKESMFTAWMEANKTYPEAKYLTYSKFLTRFVYDKRYRWWRPCKRGNTIGRLIWVPPSTGELFYLRMMLTIAKGPTCYEDIKKVGGIVRHSFRDACFEMGFLNDDKEYVPAIYEAKDWGSGYFLRQLFVTMLLSGTMNRPNHVWVKTWKVLADGILYQQRQATNKLDLHLTDNELKNLTLIAIEEMLQSNRRSLHEFKDMPYPDSYVTRDIGNRLIYDERDYNVNDERKNFTALFKALTGGRTAHSKFKISVPTLDNSTCNIDKNTEHAQLLQATDVIIWDEAPMAHKNCFEALDKTLKDLMNQNGLSGRIFGGKVVVFGGDFRQILPVVPRASRSDIVHASIFSSYVWDHCKVLTLTRNMRLKNDKGNKNSNDIAEFSKWILDVGDGRLSEPNDGLADIEIPRELLITDFEDPIQAIVESTYPDLLQNYTREEKEYLSFDEIDKTDATYTEVYEVLTPEFLSNLRTSGLPNYILKLKVGTPIMLMRNLDQSQGLCNGTRLIITRLANHVEARIISGKNIGNLFYIPRMSMSPSESPWPFKLIRRQFPIIVSYAMTINKSQGQSLDIVGLYLPTHVFSHGQLYVAISRVTNKNDLKILIHDNDNVPLSTTTNVVYKEVFQSLC